MNNKSTVKYDKVNNIFWHSDFPTMFSVSLIVYGQDHHSLLIRHVQYVLLITFNLQYIH